jgi:NADPH-dependent glutamate synthase beta subunit-like oxidoreductase
VNLGETVRIGKRVAVIGGGNVALDCARSAIRLGADAVEVFYRRSRNEMPAIAEEVEEAAREGVGLHLLVSPVKMVEKAGRVAGIELVQMRLGVPDGTGRPKPIPVEGSQFKVRVDTVIAAIGQRVDRRLLRKFDTNKDGTLRVDPETGATSMEGVFAGGDAVTGPGWAIDAIAAGKKGAKAIDHYLS